MKKWLALLMAAVFAVAAAGCGTGNNVTEQEAAVVDNGEITVADATGRRVTLKERPKHIVVTSASFLEPLESVGGADLLVGRPDSKTQMPDYAKKVASVGKVYQIDVEKVINCNPDLVILNKGINDNLTEPLDQAGIPYIILDMKSYDNVKQSIMTLANVTGEVAKGSELVEQMDEQIQNVKSKMPAQQSCRVAIIHSTNQGLSVQLDGSIAGSIAKMLDWENVADKDTPLANDPDTAPYSLETLAEENPEFIFVTSMGNADELKANMEQTIQSDPAWQTISAVRDGHIYYLPQNLFLLSPGIHYPEAVETMAKCVYPGVFNK